MPPLFSDIHIFATIFNGFVSPSNLHSHGRRTHFLELVGKSQYFIRGVVDSYKICIFAGDQVKKMMLRNTIFAPECSLWRKDVTHLSQDVCVQFFVISKNVAISLVWRTCSQAVHAKRLVESKSHQNLIQQKHVDKTSKRYRNHWKYVYFVIFNLAES